MAKHFHKPSEKWAVIEDIVNDLEMIDHDRDRVIIGLGRVNRKELSTIHYYITELIGRKEK